MCTCMYMCVHATSQLQEKAQYRTCKPLSAGRQSKKQRHKAKNALNSRWKPQSYEYFNLETDNVIRALFLPPAQNMPFQAPDINNLGTQISSSESQLLPSKAGNVARHAA